MVQRGFSTYTRGFSSATSDAAATSASKPQEPHPLVALWRGRHNSPELSCVFRPLLASIQDIDELRGVFNAIIPDSELRNMKLRNPYWQSFLSHPGRAIHFPATWYLLEMIPTSYHLTFLTPCFCAGANPSVAEIRAPSIRGKLRWWFRVLSGTFEEESEVFGAASGDGAISSSLMLRVIEELIQSQWPPVNPSANSGAGYLLYYAKSLSK